MHNIYIYYYIIYFSCMHIALHAYIYSICSIYYIHVYTYVYVYNIYIYQSDGCPKYDLVKVSVQTSLG